MNTDPRCSGRTWRLLRPSLLLLAVSASSLNAQTVIEGTVFEDGTSEPISNANIRLIGTDGEIVGGTLSDLSGTFRMLVEEPGTYSLAIRHIGYAPVLAEELPITEGEDLRLEVRLAPTAVPLEAVTVIVDQPATSESGRLGAFRRRAELSQRMGRGRILMREDIERMGSNSTRDLLAGLLFSSSCQHNVMLDGIPAVGQLTGISPDDLAGIEIYRGVSQIPPEYYRYGMCGLALLWTRADTPGGKPFTWQRAAVAGVLLGLLGLMMR
ncbi:MAG: carboxypeptidase regulatory-like domain-containing protein [Gemmatimonadota bacterium]